ncbi:hypothetical protein CRUP_024838 [Coryphaenoides rupestris]|nr:hypothetical protein CRUP_024838 [Coryphaenoides rupestris]
MFGVLGVRSFRTWIGPHPVAGVTGPHDLKVALMFQSDDILFMPALHGCMTLQVCPPPLSSSQSVISGLERSPATVFKPSHSRNSSTGSSRYSKQIQRGKLHGSLDVSRAVMSVNKKSKRIDLDAGDNLYHMKARSHDLFYIWLTKLCAHRIFKKNEALSVHQGVRHALSMGQGTLPSNMAPRNAQYPSSVSVYQADVATPGDVRTPGDYGTPAEASHRGVNHKVSAWLQQTDDTDATSQELARCQLELLEMGALIQRLHWLEGGVPITDTDLEQRISMQNLSLDKPKKKTGKVFGHSRTLSRVEAMGGMFTSSHLSTNSSNSSRHLGASLQSIPDYVYSQLSNPQVTSPEAKKIQHDICEASQRADALTPTPAINC